MHGSQGHNESPENHRTVFCKEKIEVPRRILIGPEVMALSWFVNFGPICRPHSLKTADRVVASCRVMVGDVSTEGIAFEIVLRQRARIGFEGFQFKEKNKHVLRNACIARCPSVVPKSGIY